MRYTLTPIYFLLELIILVGTVTNGNCSAARSGGLGSTKTQSAQAPLWFFVPPHFFVPVKCCAFFLSGTKKRQLPRTLDEIIFEFKINKMKVYEKSYT